MKYIFEGKTTKEATDKGLKELKLNKNDVEIKILEEDKKIFFDILAPRMVKVEITTKDNIEREGNTSLEKNFEQISDEDMLKQKEKVEDFLNKFLQTLNIENIESKTSIKDEIISVDLYGENIGFLIGYRGEVLFSLQKIIKAMLNNYFKRSAIVSLNIEGYREKREKALEDLADKVSKTVIKNGKNITLEPMKPYERKIIHSRLQKNNKITTFSVGKEPYRKIVIALK